MGTLTKKREMDKHLLAANFRGSRFAIRINTTNALLPYQHTDDVVNGMELLRYDFCLDEFRCSAVKVIGELKQIEKKLKNQEVGINVAKTMSTGQGVLGAALCFISAPVGAAVVGIASVATGATFCVDKFLNAKRARESARVLERDEFMEKMRRVMDRFGITDEDLLNAESDKWMFDEDIDGVLQKIFKFVTDNRIGDVFAFLGFDKSADKYRAASGSFAGFSSLAKENGLLNAIKLSPIAKALTVIGAILQVYDCYHSWKSGNKELAKTIELREKIESLLRLIDDTYTVYTVQEPDSD